MKKIKCLIISVMVMFLLLAVNAAGASAKSTVSVSNGTEAADILRNLEIVDLDENLSSPMSTQQFISAVSGMTGMDNSLVGEMYFSDYDTQGNITVTKASEVILKILNRGPLVNNNDYEKAASDTGILRKVTYGTDKVLTKENAAILLCNSLEIELYEFSNNTYSKTEDTILSKYLKVEIYKGVIESYDSYRNIVSVTLTNEDTAVEYAVESGLNMADAVNTTAYIYYNTEDNVVVAYSIYGDYTVIYDYITEINGYDDNTSYAPDQITSIYLNKADKKYKVYGGRSLTVIFDEEEVDYAVPLNYSFARIVLYKDEVVAIKAYKLTEGGLITGKDTQSIIYKQTTTKSVDNIEDYENIEVIINYKQSMYSSLNADMVFDYWQSDDKLYIVASDAVLTGELQSCGSDRLTLDGQSYYAGMLENGEMYLSRNMGHSYSKTSDISVLLGQQVGVYFDSAGNARYIKNISTSDNKFFGLITKVEMDYDTDYDNMRLTVYGNIGGTPQSKKYTLKLKNNASVTAENVFNTYKTSKSDSIYRFYVNDNNEIVNMTPIGVNESDELYYAQNGDKLPTDRKNLNSNLEEVISIYDGQISYRGINESELMFSGGGQINFNKGMGIMYLNTIDRPNDYVAYDVTNAECLSIWDKNGNVAPTYFDWATLQNYQNKRNNFAIKVVFDRAVDEYNPVLVIMLNDSNVINTSNTKKYGIITKINYEVYGENYYYRMTVKDHEHKETSYIVEEENFKEDSAWGNGVDRVPEVGDFVIYNVGGSFEYTQVTNDSYLEDTSGAGADSETDGTEEESGSTEDINEEEQYEYIETIVSEDGTANILKIIRPDEDLVDVTNTVYYETSVRLTVIDSVYDINNKLFMVNENGKILPVQRASGGIVGLPSDRMRYMVIKQSEMNKNFDYSTLEDVHTEKGNGAGSRLYVLSENEDIKAVFIAD